MITNYWLEKGISALLFIVLVFLGFLSFGYPVYFDLLFITVLVGLVACFKINPNLASIGAITLIIRVLGEFAFIYEGALSDLIFYTGALAVVYKFRFDKQTSMLLLPITLFCIAADVYWVLIDYDAPQLEGYVAGIALNCIFRNLLISRAHFCQSIPWLNLSGISLDFELYKIVSISNFLVAILILEYLIRHLTPFNPLVIYELYSYAQQLVTLFFPYFIISYLIKSRFKLYA